MQKINEELSDKLISKIVEIPYTDKKTGKERLAYKIVVYFEIEDGKKVILLNEFVNDYGTREKIRLMPYLVKEVKKGILKR